MERPPEFIFLFFSKTLEKECLDSGWYAIFIGLKNMVKFFSTSGHFAVYKMLIGKNKVIFILELFPYWT